MYSEAGRTSVSIIQRAWVQTYLPLPDLAMLNVEQNVDYIYVQ